MVLRQLLRQCDVGLSLLQSDYYDRRTTKELRQDRGMETYAAYEAAPSRSRTRVATRSRIWGIPGGLWVIS